MRTPKLQQPASSPRLLFQPFKHPLCHSSPFPFGSSDQVGSELPQGGVGRVVLVFWDMKLSYKARQSDFFLACDVYFEHFN